MMLLSGGAPATIGLADSAPIASNANYYGNAGLAFTSTFATYGAIYKAQVWVATLVNKLAHNVARLPLKVYERTDSGRIERRDSPYAQLLRNPNRRHDPFFFWLWTQSTFEIYGEAMWVKLRPRPGAPPSELWPLHPANVYTRREDDGTLIYVYHVGTASTPVLEFRQEDVVHFKTYNPDNQVRGMSRLEPLRTTLLNMDAARRANAAFWQNGMRPSLMLSTDKTLSKPVMERLVADIGNIHGSVDNFGKVAVLEEGLTPTVVNLSAEEMQYVESLKLGREESCALYDMPPPAVHILDRATFSNITEQMRSVYRDTMAPRVKLDEAVLDTQLRPDFDPQGRFYAEFLMDEVMRGAFEQRAVANQSAIFSGQRTPNEIRAQDNLPALPGGDDLYINSAAIPLPDAQEAPASGTDIVASPQHVKAIGGCTGCGGAGPLSRRVLCRSCEGRSSRMREITA